MGNRLSMTPAPSGSVAGIYTWGCLNRMLKTTQPTVSTGGLTGTSTASMSYEYRADGMRVEKILHSWSYTTTTIGGPPSTELDDVYTRYRYDGQMPMETYVIKADSSTVLTDNGLGACGLDYVSLTTTPSGGSPTTTISFPIYDAHGNEVATLSRSGSSYALSNQRSYGAWGEVRQGATTGGPRGRYCAGIGHVQDDETGLIYMRARYYEPGSGRFVSEDAAMHGLNWFVYACSSPVNMVDSTGAMSEWLVGLTFAGSLAFACGMLDLAMTTALMVPSMVPGKVAAITNELNAAIAGLALAYLCTGPGSKLGPGMIAGLTTAIIALGPVIASIATGMSEESQAGMAAGTIALSSTYSAVLLTMCIDCPLDNDYADGN
jgi:RHS repeat-associated protein